MIGATTIGRSFRLQIARYVMLDRLVIRHAWSETPQRQVMWFPREKGRGSFNPVNFENCAWHYSG